MKKIEDQDMRVIADSELEAIQGGASFRELLRQFRDGFADGVWDAQHRHDTPIRDYPDGTLA